MIELARQIVDTNQYLTLATADGTGRPWASPVWYAHEDYAGFLWVSRPDTRHSRNIAARPEISMVIFDSTVAPAQAQGIYLDANAEELHGAERDRAIEVYSARSVARGLPAWGPGEVTAPAERRLYRAIVAGGSLLAEGDRLMPAYPPPSPGIAW
jgi:uncharacterized protein YhbP (UPF0306 family)